MKTGIVTQIYPNGTVTVWFEKEQFGSKYFPKGKNLQISPGDSVLCWFKDAMSMGTITHLETI